MPMALRASGRPKGTPFFCARAAMPYGTQEKEWMDLLVEDLSHGLLSHCEAWLDSLTATDIQHFGYPAECKFETERTFLTFLRKNIEIVIQDWICLTPEKRREAQLMWSLKPLREPNKAYTTEQHNAIVNTCHVKMQRHQAVFDSRYPSPMFKINSLTKTAPCIDVLLDENPFFTTRTLPAILPAQPKPVFTIPVAPVTLPPVVEEFNVIPTTPAKRPFVSNEVPAKRSRLKYEAAADSTEHVGPPKPVYASKAAGMLELMYLPGFRPKEANLTELYEHWIDGWVKDGKRFTPLRESKGGGGAVPTGDRYYKHRARIMEYVLSLMRGPNPMTKEAALQHTEALRPVPVQNKKEPPAIDGDWVRKLPETIKSRKANR